MIDREICNGKKTNFLRFTIYCLLFTIVLSYTDTIHREYVKNVRSFWAERRMVICARSDNPFKKKTWERGNEKCI